MKARFITVFAVALQFRWNAIVQADHKVEVTGEYSYFKIAIRVADADYVLTRFANNFTRRFQMGVQFRF